MCRILATSLHSTFFLNPYPPHINNKPVPEISKPVQETFKIVSLTGQVCSVKNGLFHLIGRSYQCEITYQLKSQVHFVIKPTKQEKNSTLNKTSIEYHFKDRKEQKSRIGLGPNLNNTNSGQTGVQYLHYSARNLTFTVYFREQTETKPVIPSPETVFSRSEIHDLRSQNRYILDKFNFYLSIPKSCTVSFTIQLELIKGTPHSNHNLTN